MSTMTKGQISVETENIFPIIKQFLYNDQEIFLRELVSNAVDATSKLKAASRKGDFSGELGDLTINIAVDKEAKTITISDHGIGMTREEVEKYLNQVAFSSAGDFLEKYKDNLNVIGKFGLGFYSAFMVADRVEVVTKGYSSDQATIWINEGEPEYEIGDAERAERGTDIILHVSEDAIEYLEKEKIEGLLTKYCRFLPVPIQFGMKTETSYETVKEMVKEKDEDGNESEVEKDVEKSIDTEVANVINGVDPIWKKNPSELSDDEYKAFYKELHPHGPDPLFWIHLNIDYPFNLTGVLYFPPLQNQFEVQKNNISLYSNQVYVTDEVKDIIPEFLMLLHGIIDSPDIPLNVSRSALQSDRQVKQITGYISKKVSEKLHEIFKGDREDFNSKWKDLGPIVKYGMLTDEKFFDRASKFALVKELDGTYFTFDELKEKIGETQKDKHDKIIALYTTGADDQASYIDAARSRDYTVLEFGHVIDNHWIQQIEQKGGGFTFVRVDSDTIDNLIQKDETRESVMSEEQQKSVEGIFEKVVKASGNGQVQMQALSPEDMPVQITRNEFMRRMTEMQAMQGGGGGMNMPEFYNVVINTNHPLVAEKLANAEGEYGEMLAKQLTDLARLNQGMLKGKELADFVKRSVEGLS
ncbi:MAG: molecular chaperone HtpG [Saprospiraceae bacterium]